MIKFAFLLIFTSLLCASHGQETEVDFIKINVGGPELLDIGFLADEPYFYADSTARTRAYEDPNAPVVPILWGEVYRTHRYTEGGTLSYNFPVSEGVFSVGLMFVEQYDGVAINGGRIFDLYVNNALLDQGIDVWTMAGEKLYEPYFLKKLDISPVNGYISISLVPVTENPMLSGIVIEGTNAASILWETKAPSDAAAVATSQTVASPLPAVTPVAVPDLVVTPVPVAPEEPLQATENATIEESTDPEEESTADGPASTTSSGPGVWRNVEYNSGNPVARHEACAVFAGGLVYNIGGRGMKPVSVFNPVTGEWSRRTGPPVEINHMQCVFYKNKIYIGGSWFGEFPYEKEHTVMWAYDIQTDTWLTLKGLPEGRRRGGGAFVVYNDIFYLSHGAVGGHGAHATTTGYLDMYNPVTNEWTALPDGPGPRDHTAGAVINGKLCVAGGRNGGTADFWNANLAPVVCYSFVAKKWEVRASLPVPRGGAMVGTTCSGLIMIAGGEGKTPENQAGQAFDRVDLYDDSTNSFLEPSYMTSRRHGSGLAITSCDCGSIYVPSGSAGLGGGPEVTTTDVFSPDGSARHCA